jgi:hypothetical protein
MSGPGSENLTLFLALGLLGVAEVDMHVGCCVLVEGTEDAKMLLLRRDVRLLTLSRSMFRALQVGNQVPRSR